MARNKRTRKTSDNDASETTDEDEVPAESSSSVLKKVRKTKSTFTAVLENATTYELAGKVFHRDLPTEVKRQHLQMFKNNGWFRVVE